MRGAAGAQLRPEETLAVDIPSTPALVLNLDAAEANIGRMAALAAANGCGLRPHAKAHKSPDLARRQIAAGAVGITTATAEEALAFAAEGIDDILVANQVAVPEKMDALARAARELRITVAVDDEENVRDLAARATAAGSVVGVLVEVDIGMGRCGVRHPADAANLALLAADLPGLMPRGVMGYEGHCIDDPDPVSRRRRTEAAVGRLSEAVAALESCGLPAEVVSAGGTGTADITSGLAPVTEIQAGSYVLMDVYHQLTTAAFAVALTVRATVISRHGDLIVVDAGRKALGGDLALPQLADVAGETAFVHEEHSGYRVEPGRMRVGDQVSIVVGYAPTAVNLHGAYHVVAGGTVVDRWDVCGRYW
jgi:D-serine deaminase-like pyridoxal phosphate-dependent protein